MNDPFEHLFECIFNLPHVLFVGKIEETECTSRWKRLVGDCARMTHQPRVHGRHCITIVIEKMSTNKNLLKNFLQNGAGDEAQSSQE